MSLYIHISLCKVNPYGSFNPLSTEGKRFRERPRNKGSVIRKVDMGIGDAKIGVGWGG